jgi:hypothetical protein
MTKDELISILDSWDSLTLMKHTVEQYPDYFQGLMEIAMNGSDRHGWRAAWIADKIEQQEPGMVAPWIEQITERLKGLNHSGKKRQFLKLVSLYPVSVQNKSFLVDYCLECLDNSSDPPAVKAHAMQILYNISQEEPELKAELLQILEFVIEKGESAGIKARAQRLAAKLAKETRGGGR